MRDQELPNRFRLNVIVLSEDRSREINFRPDPHEPGKLTRQVTIWTRKVKLDDNVHVHESPKGELRAVKRVSRKDGVLPDPTSELDVLGQVSKAME